jgi:hypothetical protein
MTSKARSMPGLVKQEVCQVAQGGVWGERGSGG